MNLLLIIFNKDIKNLKTLNDKIYSLGDTFYVFDNVIFLETEESTKSFYDRLSKYEIDTSSLLVLYVTNKELGFWGRMDTELWKWLEEKGEQCNGDGLELNYAQELRNLTIEGIHLTHENKKLKEQLFEKEKVIENLIQQLSIVSSK